jgi:hypothetical protein
MELKHPKWWGHYALPAGKGGIWRIGPLSLRALRRSHEILLDHERGDDSLAEGVEIQCPVDIEEQEMSGEVSRLAIRRLGKGLELRPRLADRNVVTRPEIPLSLPPGERADLYVSTLLWVEVLAAETGAVLADLATFRPSDTWFGPSTKEGTLCYASRTCAGLHLEEVPRRPHRALTKVTLKNSMDQPLRVDRLNIPVIHLSLFSGGDQTLWTQSVHLENKQEDSPTDLTIGKGPPKEAGPAELVSGEREAFQKTLLSRGFASLVAIKGGRHGGDMG